jgi:hypothetical protein
MRWLLAAALLLAATPAFADEPLPSRDLMFPPFVVQAFEPTSFDLIDFREEQCQLARNRIDVQPHSLFVIKRHVGVAGGYDNGVSRGSVGFYLTVAEWGRWNFGVPSPEFGFGRYPVYDSRRQQAVTKN